MLWLLILSSTLLQIFIYWVCIRLSVKWIDYLIFLFFVTGNFWFIPNILYPAQNEESSCTLDGNGMAHIFFALFGTAGSIVSFIGYGILRETKK